MARPHPPAAVLGSFTVRAHHVLAVAGVLLLAATRATNLTGDSLMYLAAARSEGVMLHPHHLLFVPAVQVLLRVAALLGVSIDPLTVAQAHNLVWAGVALAAAGSLAHRTFASNLAGAVGVIGLLAPWGFSAFATQAEVYVPAVACGAVLLLCLERGVEEGRAPRTGLVASFWLAAFVLYHQTNVLFVVPMLVFFFTALPARRAIVAASWSILPAGAVVLMLYLLAYWWSGGTPALGGFLSFCLAYVDAPAPNWGTTANMSVAGVWKLLEAQSRSLVSVYAVQRYVPQAVFGILIAGVVASNVVAARRQQSRRRRSLRLLLLAWLGIHGVFFLWWLPGEVEFFIISLLPLLLLALFVLDDVGSRSSPGGARMLWWGAAAGVAALVILNVTRVLLPDRGNRGRHHAAARALDGMNVDGCVALARFRTRAALTYYHEYASQDLVILEQVRWSHVRGLAVPPAESPHRCRIAEIADLDPAIMATPSMMGVPTARWREHYRWLFDCVGDGPLRCRDVTVRAGGDREAFAVLETRRASFTSWAALGERIDEDLRRVGFRAPTFGPGLSRLDGVGEVRAHDWAVASRAAVAVSRVGDSETAASSSARASSK